jgi:hypothetical protein
VIRLRKNVRKQRSRERESSRELVVSPVRDALLIADDLCAQGRYFEAIEFLGDTNRAGRDHRLDQRLVELRFDAFKGTEWSRERPTVPERCADLFPDARIPEIGIAELDVGKVRSAILNHGCLLVRGFASAERVELLVSDIDRALAAYDSQTDSVAVTPVAPWFVPFKGERGNLQRTFRRIDGSVLAVDSPPALYDVIATFEDAGVGRMVCDYFGERPALLGKKWTLRRVSHAAGPSDWHQDGAFMGDDIRSLNVWLALSHCGDDAPGIDIVARRLSEVVQTGTDGARMNWTVGPGLVERIASDAVVRPIFEAGDALIFDHLNLHRTAIDPGMIRDRYAIEAWFLAPSTYDAMTAPGADGGPDDPPRDQLPLVY